MSIAVARDPTVNIEAVSISADGERVNVPHHCENCGERWLSSDESLGARYMIEGRWLCVACRCN